MCRSDASCLRHDINLLYGKEPLMTRFLASYRPLICPFEALLAEIPSKATVLDIGCGQGVLLTLLAFRGQTASGTGFEANENALNVARRVVDSFSLPNLHFLHGHNARQLPEEKYDIVMMIDVMHHVKIVHQRELFEAAAERVSLGGRMIYKDMSNRSPWCSLQNRLHDLLLARQIIHYVPIETVQTWALNAGLKLLHKKHVRLYGYAHDLLVFEKTA